MRTVHSLTTGEAHPSSSLSHPRRQLAASSGARVHYIDCAGPLLLDKSREIDRGLMPDALHPNAAGYELLFSRCWDAALGRILGSTNSTAGG